MVRAEASRILTVVGAEDMPEPDVRVITSDGLLIFAHSKVLAAGSPVLENIIQRPQKRQSNCSNITIAGVPFDAVSAFIKFLYSSKCSEDQMEKYGIPLLALSHVYLVPQLKQMCAKDLAVRMSIENVVDVLQLARLCDAPDLYVKCMKLVSNNLKMVEAGDGWKFLQKHDPLLELEILQFIDESETRKQRMRKRRQDKDLYVQLSDAMECLEHICSEGCTTVGPINTDTSRHKGPCAKFSTCRGVQLLINHFGTCTKRVNGGCLRCKRMWQLFRLHSSICDQRPDGCKVPLCRQFKLKTEQDGSDARWRLLVRKVMSAKVTSSLSNLHVKKEKEPIRAMGDQGFKI